MSGDRFDFAPGELRRRTVRGAAVTGAFLVGIDGLVLAQGLIVTALLAPADIGLYGIASITVLTLVALKRVGIDEAYVQQERGDEEAFQIAFTLELALSVTFALGVGAAAPLVAAAYSEPQLLGLTAALAYLPIAFALQAPLWIFFRRMDYGRQRALQAIQPAVSFAVTVPLAATGFGVWSLVVGPLAGYVVATTAAVVASPYRLGLRVDRAAARRYVAFSGWVLVATLAALALQQGQVLAFDVHRGLAGAGFLTLAVTVTRYVDRADQIVTATIYPAICALQGRTRALDEMFGKSNRATLLYVVPFTLGVVLFAPDLVAFVLGRRWEPAVVLLQGLAAAGFVQHLGFNWFAFFRAHGDARPPAIEAVVGAVAFGALAVPGLALWGAGGFVGGRIAATCLAVAVRWRYLRRLLPEARLAGLLAPVAPPAAAAAASALALRAALWGGERTAVQAAVEVVAFVAVYVVLALRRERALVGELLGELRAGRAPAGA